MKVVVDTNVVISGLHWERYSSRLLKLAFFRAFREIGRIGANKLPGQTRVQNLQYPERLPGGYVRRP